MAKLDGNSLEVLESIDLGLAFSHLALNEDLSILVVAKERKGTLRVASFDSKEMSCRFDVTIPMDVLGKRSHLLGNVQSVAIKESKIVVATMEGGVLLRIEDGQIIDRVVQTIPVVGTNLTGAKGLSSDLKRHLIRNGAFCEE